MGSIPLGKNMSCLICKKHYSSSKRCIIDVDEIDEIDKDDEYDVRIDEDQQVEGQLSISYTEEKVKNQCVICLDKPITYIYPTCKHACVCTNCVNNSNNSNNNKCPICRTRSKPIRFYLS